jgi:hypothetical protein
MKRPSRPGEHETERSSESIQPSLLRKQTGVLRKSKNYDETFLTEPTSLEMFSTVIRKSAPCSDIERLLPSGP